MATKLIIIIIFISVITHTITEFSSVGDIFDFVKKYERSSLEVERWGIGHGSEWIRVKFKAFGSVFILKLKPDYSTVSPFVSVNIDGKFMSSMQIIQTVFDSSICSGVLEGTAGSLAFGKIENGSFDGFVRINNDIFYIEPVSKYYLYMSNTECIVYRKSDIIHKNGTYFAEGKFPITKLNSTDRNNLNQHLLKTVPGRFIAFGQSNQKMFRNRKKRSEIAISCNLHLVADHTFFNYVGGGSVSSTIAEMRYQIAQADIIFRSTDFDGDGYGDNVGFEIANITIFTSQNSPGYKMPSESQDAYTFLDLFSSYHFEDYCIGFAFSYREFNDQILGLAWIASSNIYGSSGGICQQRVHIYSEGKDYSLNTAFVSMLNDGKRLSSYKSALIVAHELGHTFGSPHDDPDDTVCNPGDEFGTYIMNAFANDGNKPNNNKFSSCSINNIYPVIVNKGGCFMATMGPRCGNGIVEIGEECDCGNTATCQYTDPCCTPSDIWSIDLPCTLLRSRGSVCSPRVSQCCESNCTITPMASRKVCGTVSECAQESICNGVSAECPHPTLALNGTVCESGRKICSLGKCSRSICERYNLLQCRCQGESRFACQICCKHKYSESCIPLTRLGVTLPINSTLKLTSGEPCNGDKGFCNINGICVMRDPNSVINRLGNMFSEEAASDFKTWMKQNWYYILIAVAGFLFMLALFCVSRRKSENVQSHAYRMGRFEQVMAEASTERRSYEQMLNCVETMFDQKIENIRNDQEAREYTLAVARLATFFPTVPKTDLAKIAKNSSSEDVAVRMLLIRGFPLRRMLLPFEREIE